MARTLSLHDTHSGETRALVPREPGRIGIYACGPTVYSRVHVGNARAYVFPMLLKRFLEHEGYAVTLVINVTDINDKIYEAARAAGVGSQALAREMTAHYAADTDRLGLGRPDSEPRASETMGPIVALIETLMERGHAYAAEGDVYFRVRSLTEYGSLSHQDVARMDQGEGVEGAERKEDPLDFALWKAGKPGEDTVWDAPWGSGRPGWHIECSAMAEAHLGLEFDVHAGGIDLLFPHHENEAAQTLAARGRSLARTWAHNGMVQLDSADADGAPKMGKSLGNVRGLAEVLDDVGPEALVAYFCSGHYRQPLAFSAERLEAAARRVRGIREAGRRLVPGPSPEALAPLREAFFDALADDFNTPAALAALADWMREANRREGPVGDADLREMLGVLGLAGTLAQEAGPPPEALALLGERAEARAARRFEESDRLRDLLRDLGWEVRDLPEGPELVPAS